MNASLVRFGVLKVEGRTYEHDVVIEGGAVSKRRKKPSKVYSSHYGHTPLSAEEHLPWGGSALIIGTGAYGRLPVMDGVFQEAKRRKVKVLAVPTEEACTMLRGQDAADCYAILHATC
jgi:hypothetical protein